MLKPGDHYPITKETTFSPQPVFNLKFDNGFSMCSMKQKTKKFSFSTKFRFKVDQYLNIELENEEYETVFKCFDDVNLI